MASEPMRLWQHSNGYFYSISAGNKMASLRMRDRRQAERIFNKKLNAYLEGRIIQPNKTELTLLKDFIEEYADYRKGMAISTQKADALALRHFLEYYGNRPMKGITDKVLDQYGGFLRAKYGNSNTRNDYIRALKTALITAGMWKYLSGVNLDKFEQTKLDDRKPQYMTVDEVARLLNASQSCPVMTAVPIMVDCGISTAEIMGPLNITNDEIQYKRKKTGKLVKIAINDELKPYISGLRGFCRLIPWKNKRTFAKKFGEIVEAAGISGISSHKVRHTLANVALRAGMPLDVVSLCLGHKDTAITKKFYVDDDDYSTSKEHINRISYKSDAK